MSFFAEQRHVDSYREQGYCVFEGLIPPSLITDLRKTSERAREIAHQLFGPQAQRLPRIDSHLDDAELHSVFDFHSLPELHAALDIVLSPAHRPPEGALTNILFEPKHTPYCVSWHRDWRDNIPHCDLHEWLDEFHNPEFFNQVNCPLYEDSCTWIVPGSHVRGDSAAECAAFPELPVPPLRWPEDTAPASLERDCLAHCEAMPGAIQACLGVGDYMLYRSSMWHLGSYSPKKKRATLHEHASPPSYYEWCDKRFAGLEGRREAGLPWDPAAIRHLPASR
jgi:ectoine hydroxylase-related dioxygenase (phytanoyl-CoA dioxygenase family)